MNQLLNAVKLTEKVYWVGAVDWEIKSFHGYATERGTTYNAYLVIDEKITLIDTVKAPFRDELLARISSVIDPEKIDYIVSNHSEMDHSGSLPDMIKIVKPEKVFASPMGEKNLKAHFGSDLKIDVVKTGDSINLGANTLSFVETKMLHWPDSMITYLSGEKVLFSQDAFGMHLAGLKLFADEYPDYVIEWEAAKYFANILMLYASPILGVLNALPGLNLDIKFIAPDHGPVWRNNPGWIIEQYRKWSVQKPEKHAIIIYDTMWESTETMARSIADGISSAGVEVEIIPLQSRDRSHVATMALKSGALIIGSSTLNNNLLPTVADILTYLKGLRPLNKIGFAFGSYGWSGEAVKQINEYLQAANVELVCEGVKTKYVPDQAALQACFEAGVMLGGKLIEKIEAGKITG
ncbi:MAG: FprA family A-type flavoprotein [Victivallaceae bacterium]